MAIRVRFDKNGFYHPAFGRLGRGDHRGDIYSLPDQFAEQEDIVVPVMDPTTRPPRQIGERKVTRFKYLPVSAEIIDDDRMAEIVEKAEEEGQTPPKAIKPKTDAEELKRATKTTGRGRDTPSQGAIERTTGRAPRARRPVATD